MYVRVVGNDVAGLSDLLGGGGFGGGLSRKPLRLIFPHYDFKSKVVCNIISLMNFVSLAFYYCFNLQGFPQTHFK